MLHSHLFLMALFAFFVSLVFAVIAKDEPREQFRFGGMMFGGFVVVYGPLLVARPPAWSAPR